MTRLTILLVLTVATAAQAFWGGDDNKYIKKFAMMKVRTIYLTPKFKTSAFLRQVRVI
jgi:hypothetical protein